MAFGAPAAAANPRVVALVAERQALEQQVAALRARKASMAADAYDAELERLLVAIAEKTQAIRAAGGHAVRRSRCCGRLAACALRVRCCSAPGAATPPTGAASWRSPSAVHLEARRVGRARRR